MAGGGDLMNVRYGFGIGKMSLPEHGTSLRDWKAEAVQTAIGQDFMINPQAYRSIAAKRVYIELTNCLARLGC